jgi:hypothetical protein
LYIYVSVRETGSKKYDNKRMATNRERETCSATEFGSASHTVNDAYTASMEVKFNLMSMQFIYTACFEADRL